MAVRRLLREANSVRCVAIALDEAMLRSETLLQERQIVDWTIERQCVNLLTRTSGGLFSFFFVSRDSNSAI
jgi:hypothetical protein